MTFSTKWKIFLNKIISINLAIIALVETAFVYFVYKQMVCMVLILLEASGDIEIVLFKKIITFDTESYTEIIPNKPKIFRNHY